GESAPAWFVAVWRRAEGQSRSYPRIVPARHGAPYFSTFAISSQPSTRGQEGGLSLPRPPAFDSQYQRPAEEGTNQHEPGEQAKTHDRQFMRYRFNDIGRHEHLEAEQE